MLEAATLEEARALLDQEQVDVVLLDVHVGSDDGRDLLDELRAAESPDPHRDADRSVESTRGRLATADRVVMSCPARPARGDCARAGRRCSCKFDYMSVTKVRTAAEFEAELQQYLYERSEEGRAVRVGERRCPSRLRSSRVTQTSSSASKSRRCAGRKKPLPASSRSACTACGRPASPGSSARARRTGGRARDAQLAARVQWQGEELPLLGREGEARRPRRLPRARGAGRAAGASLCRLQRRPPRADHRRRGARRRASRASRTRSHATRTRSRSRCASSSARSPRRAGAWTTAWSACARSGTSAWSCPTVPTSLISRTSWICGFRRSSPRTRRSARSRCAWTP